MQVNNVFHNNAVNISPDWRKHTHEILLPLQLLRDAISRVLPVLLYPLLIIFWYSDIDTYNKIIIVSLFDKRGNEIKTLASLLKEITHRNVHIPL